MFMPYCFIGISSIMDVKKQHLQEEEHRPVPESAAQHQPCSAAQRRSSAARSQGETNIVAQDEVRSWLPRLAVGSARVTPLPSGTCSKDANSVEPACSGQLDADAKQRSSPSLLLSLDSLVSQSITDCGNGHCPQGLPATSLTELNLQTLTNTLESQQESRAEKVVEVTASVNGIPAAASASRCTTATVCRCHSLAKEHCQKAFERRIIRVCYGTESGHWL